MSEIEYVRANQDHLKPQNIMRLVDIGRSSYAFAFGGSRSIHEVRQGFNVDMPGTLNRAMFKYDEFIRKGAMVIAHVDMELDYFAPVGYALARPEQQGLLAKLQKPAKRTVELAEVCVVPAYWQEGVASTLARKALTEFHPDNVPVTYVPEGAVVLNALAEQLGFKRTPEEQEPRAHYLFTPAAAPVKEYRYALPSVRSIES